MYCSVFKFCFPYIRYIDLHIDKQLNVERKSQREKKTNAETRILIKKVLNITTTVRHSLKDNAPISPKLTASHKSLIKLYEEPKRISLL